MEIQPLIHVANKWLMLPQKIPLGIHLFYDLCYLTIIID